MAEIILLDGGTGQELVSRSTHPASPLWSAEIMEREPDLVAAVQRDFIDAGATVITLNSYSATYERLVRYMEPTPAQERFVSLQQRAIAIAQDARDGAGEPVAIAGCLPPLVASFHAEVSPDFEACLASYLRIVALQKPACDVILVETMAAVHEARAAARACAQHGCPAWVSFTVNDEDGTYLRSGEALADGVDAVLAEGAEAILLNCSRPEAITDGLGVLAKRDIRFGAYANGFVDAAELKVGTTVDGMGVRSDLDPDAYAKHAIDWIERGARVVGGCCEVGPLHISVLRERIIASGHSVGTPPIRS